MKVYNKGVLAESEVYFHTHSKQAHRIFFYPLCVGHYVCDETYQVNRQQYNSFLILYVVRGSGYIMQKGEKVTLSAGGFAFLDCYQPHCYGTEVGWEIYWVHFDGCLAREYYDTCTEHGNIFHPSNSYTGAHCLRKTFEDFAKKRKINEAILSRRIVDLLTELLCTYSETTVEGHCAIVEESLAYISENLDQPLSLQQIADHVSLSPFHFSRIFKKETGFTPHEYIIHARVNMAKYVLRGTQHTIKSVARQCGFGNESTFCTTFKKVTGKTPAQYRSDIT